MRLFAKDKNGHFIREVNGIKLPFPLTEFMKVRFVGICIFRNFNGDFPLLHCDKRLPTGAWILLVVWYLILTSHNQLI